ncbi:MAG: C4-dicarboxylate transporter, partial [Spirosoma sp.]|nr:C4-dicarboxylate transporter [Spirosoma sp.]
MLIAHNSGVMNTVKKTIQELPPAYFALVMSTGIVAIGAHLVGFSRISEGLFWLNNLAYGILLLLLFARLIFFFPAVLAELTSHEKGPGFFTVVAGSCVLGIQYSLQKQGFATAAILWFLAVATWFILTYSLFFLLIIKAEKPPFETGINGAWLLLVVS